MVRRVLCTLLILMVALSMTLIGCSRTPTGNGDAEPIVGEEEGIGEEDVEIKTDSGRFVGQADSNFIEVRISGVPEEIDPRVFRLGDEVKEKFEQYNLETDDEIIFIYISDENGYDVIIDLNKFK
jgi:hypothetical protein